MKSAILGTGIGWGILCIILAAVLIPVGVIATSPEIIDAAAASGSSATRAQLEEAARLLQVILIVSGAWLVVGAIYSFVLVGLRNGKFGKGAGIALGVVGIVVGADLPAVFFIVDSAKSRE